MSHEEALHLPQPRLTAERQRALANRKASARVALKNIPFRDRRFSKRTVDALVAHGIDAPERLLFMTEAQLREVPGIDKASMAEINAYRDRCLKASPPP